MVFFITSPSSINPSPNLPHPSFSVKITTHEEKRHNLANGDNVTFKEVQGMEEVNNKVFKVKVLSPYTFTIDHDTTHYKPYTHGGTPSLLSSTISHS